MRPIRTRLLKLPSVGIARTNRPHGFVRQIWRAAEPRQTGLLRLHEADRGTTQALDRHGERLKSYLPERSSNVRFLLKHRAFLSISEAREFLTLSVENALSRSIRRNVARAAMRRNRAGVAQGSMYIAMRGTPPCCRGGPRHDARQAKAWLERRFGLT